jgi:uncharacterized repeat protein (TIGR01451 family)
MKTTTKFKGLLFLLSFFLLSGLKAQLAVSITINKQVCNADGSITATASGGVPPYQYTWVSYQPPNIPATTATLVNLNSGFYEVEVTDAAGNSAYAYQNLPSNIFYTSSTVSAHCPSKDGSVSVTVSGGMAPYTYSWNTGQVFSGISSATNTLAGIGGGSYICHVTDGNGCVTSAQNDTAGVVQSISNVTSVVSSTPSDCFANDGSVTATASNGVAPYTYSWSEWTNAGYVVLAGQTASNLPPDTYLNVAITDAQGCASSNTAYIGISPNALTSSMAITSAVCSDGGATVTPAMGTAPYTYFWSMNNANGTPAVFTTQSISHQTAGTSGNVLVTDAKGCQTSNYVYISQGPSPIQSSDQITNATCPLSNGAIALTVWGGTGPYVFSWSNGANTQNISNLSSGSYDVSITDATGCSTVRNKYVANQSGMYPYVTSTATNCTGSSGTASVTVQGGTPPYAYLWTSGQTSASISGLASGYYGVSIVDNNGCRNDQTYTFVSTPASCYAEITGTVYNDVNGNCVFDAGDSPIPQTVVYGSTGLQAATDDNGNYTLSVVTPGPVVVTHVAPTGWALGCPSSPASYTLNTSAPNVYSGNNFYDKPGAPVQDLFVFVGAQDVRPGSSQHYYMEVINEGNTTMSGTVTFKHDPRLVFSSSWPAASNYNVTTSVATYTFSNLAPFQTQGFQIECQAPTTLAIGATLSALAEVLPVIGDVHPANNRDSVYAKVVGSYDPNEKSVMPVGVGAQGYISATNNVLKYGINFQNTGTDSANVVAIVDTLDASLDISTFTLGSHSHPVSWTISENRVLTFTFQNIGLLSMNQSESGSKGFVGYTINQKAGLAEGTVIRNKAAIYFDYNRPVVTNNTINTITSYTGIVTNAKPEGTVSIYPNPFSGSATLKIEGVPSGNTYLLRLFDVGGREVISQQVSAKETLIDGSKLDPGFYFYRVESKGEQLIGQGKIVLTR